MVNSSSFLKWFLPLNTFKPPLYDSTWTNPKNALGCGPVGFSTSGLQKWKEMRFMEIVFTHA